MHRRSLPLTALAALLAAAGSDRFAGTLSRGQGQAAEAAQGGGGAAPRAQRLPRQPASPPPGSCGPRRHGRRRRRRVPRHPRRRPRGHQPRNTFVVSAGDLIGASPLLSALFHDEPTDRGDERDRPRLQRGRQPRVRRGRHRAAAHAGGRLPPGRRLPGRRRLRRRRLPSSWPPTSSTRRPATALPAVRDRAASGGAKVAFIGMTLEGTPTIVSPAGIAGLDVPRRGRHRQRARAAS